MVHSARKAASIRELMGLDVASRCLKISTIKCLKVFPTQTLNPPKPKCALNTNKTPNANKSANANINSNTNANTG